MLRVSYTRHAVGLPERSSRFTGSALLRLALTGVLVCAGSAHELRPESASRQQAVAGGVAPAQPAADANEPARGLAARVSFIAEGATPPS